MNRRSSYLALVCCSLALAACSEQDEAPRAVATSASAAAPGALAGKDASVAASEEAPVRARKLIQNAELQLEVEDYTSARQELDALLASHGGYVADVTIEHVDGEVSRAQLVLQVPNERLASFLRETAGSGEVLHEQLRSQDITDQYVDLEARLKNAQRLEARLVELMGGQTSTVADLLEVERELARVRGEIERMEGQKRLWDKQVALSTVNLDLLTRRVYVAAAPASLGERVVDTFEGSVTGLVTVARGTVLLLVALAPWLLPLLLLGWLLRGALRRLPRRRVSVAPSAPSAPAMGPGGAHPARL